MIRRLLPVVLGAALVFGGCSVLRDDGEGRMSATTTFEDVADMADGAPVFMADVRIGNVSDIELDDTGTMATVTLSFDRDAGVPADVQARVRRTSPLGEKFVELRPMTTEPDPPLLEDGAVIENAEVVSDFEQVVASGTEFFGALGASEIATLLEEGAEGFGGQGPRIRSVLSDISEVVGGFAENTGNMTTLIESIDELASATGPAAQSHARALEELATTTRTLDEQSDQLLDLVDSLGALSREGASIMREHFVRLDRQLEGLRSVTRAVANGQQGLEMLLEYLRGHNTALDLGVKGEFSQVLNDFILCGVPGGGEGPGVNDCRDGA
jgi:phospholipid/cholesterol/gamma-HCH transport system substrate-binding protein